LSTSHGTRNGFEVPDLARKHRPDLILMDIQLPEVSGLEVTKWLKARVGQNLDHKAFGLDEFLLGHFSSLRVVVARVGVVVAGGAGQDSSYDALASPGRSARSA
jgi:CheY-like chemotaxis protein